MTCGAIQNESRPMIVCHWMSHWTPQLARTFATRSAQSAARRAASEAGRTPASAAGSVAAFEPIAMRLLYLIPSPRRGPCAPASGGRSRGADRKSTRLNSSHDQNSYAVFCLKKKKKTKKTKHNKNTKKNITEKKQKKERT